ncbi:MAG: hypothetical protein RLZZ479_12 [Bacteroidota bacterium]|jgi:hypothetical protein
MKISISNTFDISTVANTKSYQELQSYFDYANRFTYETVQALTKKLTLNDNFSYATLNLSVSHGEPIVLKITSYSHILINSIIPILTYDISQNSLSQYVLTIFFKQTQNIFANSATWVAGTIVKYSVQNIQNYSIGDVVIFSGFRNQTNNGTFLIVGIDIDNSFVFVQNYNRDSATGDEILSTFTGKSLVKNFVTIGVIN